MSQEKDKSPVIEKVNFNIVGRRYYVVSDSTGVPAADFHPAASGRGSVIVPRDEDSSGDIKV